MTRLSLAHVRDAVDSLPSLPAVVLELIASLDDDDADIDVLSDKITLDQALSAKALRLANSPFYGMQRQVLSVRDAVTVLGFRTLRSLATTAALADALGRGGNPSFGFLAFWRHSVATALCARSLATHCGLPADTAHTAGLVHDIGRLVLATRFANAYEQVIVLSDAGDTALLDTERAVLGLDHAMVGEALARHWKFPHGIVSSIAHHHQAALADDPLARVVHLADVIAHALDEGWVADDLLAAVSEQELQALGLNGDQLISVRRDAAQQFETACGILA